MEKNILVILIIFVVSINSQVTNQRATVDSEIQPEQQQQQQTSDIEIESKGAPVNHVYDPTIYSTYLPQDIVQSYVSQYGQGYQGAALEGFLIPTMKQQEPPTTSMISAFRTLLPASRVIFGVIVRAFTALISLFGILFVGIVLCTFTNFCYTVPLALSKETKEIVSKIGDELTVERIKRAADMLALAFNTYNNKKN